MTLVLTDALAVALRPSPVQQANPPKELPFAKDIAAFQATDAKQMPVPGQDLFIGSSSFTRWTDVQDYFPKHKILNRAFGGSTLVDVLRYVDQVVTPYRPKEVVIYCGENDFAGDPSLTADQVFGRFKSLFEAIRHRERRVPVVYVSMKPSPSRWSLTPKFTDANAKIKEYLAHQPRTTFIDVWPVMLAADGKPKPEIYVGDRLHMNSDGYRLWQPLIEPYLK